jgi:hypothetical protein
MKKIFRILLIIFISLNLITVITFLVYSPKDYCERAEIAKGLYQDYSEKLDMTYSEYMALSKSKRWKLYEKDRDYLMLKPSYEAIEESVFRCVEYSDISKWNRFLIDLQSGELFD